MAKKKSDKGRVIFIIVLVLVAIFAIYKAVFAANRGLDTGGIVWMGTEAGSCATTDTSLIQNPLMVKTIVIEAASSSNITILTDGLNTETILKVAGSKIIPFGEGKNFKKGLYLHSVTTGDTVFIYLK